MLGRLPLSLLLSSLLHVVASAPAPVQHDALTPANFKDTISTGVWLIEHYSPYCRHCRDFAPTWEKLVEENDADPNAGIHMAQVNCAVNGDLCSENNVLGYPQMNLYNEGKFVETYKGSREHDVLAAYLEKHAERPKVAEASPSVFPFTPLPSPSPTRAPALHIQTPRASLNPNGQVHVIKTTPDLDINGALQALKAEGPLFVKYYAPWCGHCKKLEPHWKQLAKYAQGKMTIAQVNCDDDKDRAANKLCAAQGVEGYPSLFFYKNGVKSDYTGGRKFDKMKEFVDQVSESGVRVIATPAELESHVAESEVSYLLLHQDPAVLDTVTHASSVLLGSPKILVSDSIELFTRFGVTDKWALLSFKDNSLAPTSIFHGQSADGLKTWLLSNRLPTSTELTQDTFQKVMNAGHQPLVVIAAVREDTKEAVARKMSEVGKVWRLKLKQQKTERDVVFAWMDAGRWEKWMKNMYGIKLSASAETPVVIADHSNLIYWATGVDGRPITLTSTSISSALDGVEKGTITSKSSESFIERTTRSINAKFTSLETFIVSHPWFSALIALLVCTAVFLGLQRMINADVEDIRGEYRRIDGQKRGALTGRKAGRLD